MNRFIFHATRWTGVAIIVMLGLCSVALLMMDVRLGQESVRGIFPDIVPGTDYLLSYQALFGINTTLTVCMLTGFSLLFLFCAGLVQQMSIRGSRMGFLWFQALFVLYLACDERLLNHEKIGSLLSINDAIWILALGVMELLVLFLIGDMVRQPWRPCAEQRRSPPELAEGGRARAQRRIAQCACAFLQIEPRREAVAAAPA